MARLLLIDSANLAFRALHTNKNLTTKDGTPISATYGFIKGLLNAIDMHKATHVAVLEESSDGSSWRKDIDSSYKSNRKEKTPEINHQFFLIKQFCDLYGVMRVSKKRMEADDLIASYASHFKTKAEIIILSSDKDLLALVEDGRVNVYDGMKKRLFDKQKVFERFGVYPAQLQTYLSFVNDTVDAVKGVHGIGKKTAASLISKYGADYDDILAAENLTKSMRAKLESGRDSFDNAFKLVAMRSNLKIKHQLSALKVPTDFDKKKLKKFLLSLDFTSIVTQLKLDEGVSMKNLFK